MNELLLPLTGLYFLINRLLHTNHN